MDGNHQWWTVQCLDSLGSQFSKFAVHQKNPRLTVLQVEADARRIQSAVDGVDDRAGQWNAQVRLQHRRGVGREDSDRLAALHTALHHSAEARRYARSRVCCHVWVVPAWMKEPLADAPVRCGPESRAASGEGGWPGCGQAHAGKGFDAAGLRL